MGTVFLFAEKGKQGGYPAFPVSGEEMEILPLAGAATVPDGDADLAIIDCGGNADDGLCLLREIKRDRPDLPIIFVTETSSEEVVLRAFRSGAREYFKRPLDLADFQKAVKKILMFKRDIPGTVASLSENLPAGLDASIYIPERLLRAISYIEQNLPNPLYLDDIARQACLSKYHFCRMFKKHVGVTPIRFMLSRRIDRAKRLLRRPEFTISSVAIRTGFCDQSEFNKQFKRITGITPSAYRKSA